MSDLIDRQKAIDEINKLEYPSSLVDVKRIIVDLPSAQSERKKGKWIHGREVYREYMGATLMTVHYSHWECSVCGYQAENEPVWKFCPNCGAYMGGGEGV